MAGESPDDAHRRSSYTKKEKLAMAKPKAKPAKTPAKAAPAKKAAPTKAAAKAPVRPKAKPTKIATRTSGDRPAKGTGNSGTKVATGKMTATTSTKTGAGAGTTNKGKMDKTDMVGAGMLIPAVAAKIAQPRGGQLRGKPSNPSFGKGTKPTGTNVASPRGPRGGFAGLGGGGRNPRMIDKFKNPLLN
jgi:hypothetical protein